MKSNRSDSLDALRGIAVMLVVFHHWFVDPVGVAAFDFFVPFFRQYGSLGVDLFFLLSGFCIHNAYVGSKSGFDPKQYLLRRWWRIYPPYFFALALAVFLNLLTNYYKWQHGGSITWNNFGPLQILSHVFLVHNLSSLTVSTISGPFWTIALEAQFYLLYLLARPLFYGWKGWLGVFAVAASFHTAAWRMHDAQLLFLPLDMFRFWIEWVLGAFLVYLVRTYPHFLRYAGFYALSFFFFCWLVVSADTWTTIRNLEKLAIALAFAFQILLFLSTEKLWSSASLKWLARIGYFSYSIYLTHFLFIDRIYTFLILKIPSGAFRLSAACVNLFLCLGIAYLFFIFFERPYLEKAASIPKLRTVHA